MIKYRPIQETNALKSVVFIVQFSQKFEETEWRVFDDSSQLWRQEFPRRSVINAVLVNPLKDQPITNTNKTVGISYERMHPDGSVELGLKFEENRILFIVGKYTNWADIKRQISPYLKSALELVSKNNSITSYAVEYNDIFFAEGNYSEFNARSLFQFESKFIPSHIFDRTENFHFHTGYFETFKDPVKHRVLTRINVDLKDSATKNVRELSIVLFHQILSYLEPWTSENRWIQEPALHKQITDRGLENFVTLHEIDKTILKEILNDKMSTQIGL